MLDKVCHTVLSLVLVARPCVDGKAAVGHLSVQGLVYDTQAIVQRAGAVVRGCQLLMFHADSSFLTAAKIQQKSLLFMENYRYLRKLNRSAQFSTTTKDNPYKTQIE